MFAKLNKTAINWNIDNEKFEYKKCADMELGKEYKLCGCFISPDNGYGEGAVLILEDCNLNIPQRYVTTIETIRSDSELVEGINAGKCVIEISEYESKKTKRKGFNITFKDV